MDSFFLRPREKRQDTAHSCGAHSQETEWPAYEQLTTIYVGPGMACAGRRRGRGVLVIWGRSQVADREMGVNLEPGGP